MQAHDAIASPGSIRHPARCADWLRQQATQQGRTATELALTITTHCGHSRLRAYRLAHGWTLEQLIAEMVTATGVGHRLVPSRVSRWERGQEHPSVIYLDALCQIYACGPVELGFGADYGHRPGVPEPLAAEVSRSTPTRGGQESPQPWRSCDLTSGSGTGNPVDRRADVLRRRVDETLSGSALSDTTVAHKESVAAQYGRTYKTQPPATFLENLLADLDDVQVLTDRKLPSSQRRDLCAVTARLAGLVSMAMVNLGQYRQSREWVHTARLAADEAGESSLRAWVATRGAVASLHLGDPHAAAAGAREAELLTRHHPEPITAMAWAIIARSAATMAEAPAARSALRHAEDVFAAVDTLQDNTAYAFTTGQLHFYRSHTLTTLGESRAAWRAQDDALAAFGPGERLDPSLVHLDRALCMVNDGDVSQGADYASTLLLQLPTVYRPTIVLRRARAVADAIPVGRRATRPVRALHEALAIDARPTR